MVEWVEWKIGGWDVISLCIDKDVVVLIVVLFGVYFVKVFNVVDCVLLVLFGDVVNLLFVGNFSFLLNEYGLCWFVDEVWLWIVVVWLDVCFDVVGLCFFVVF